MPRVLEQAYLTHYKPELKGHKIKNDQIIFNLLNWDSTSLNINMAGKDIIEFSSEENIQNLGSNYLAKNALNNTVASSNSMNGLASLLGISVPGLKYNLNQ